ncbi:META domain-containing protein [Lysobacter korlensis]|uniref:META domain-containing protein n=1 Tax=Lysobacter korlensis TaxID=553636 RepID=A0ABV6RRR9_9GAMM
MRRVWTLGAGAATVVAGLLLSGCAATADPPLSAAPGNGGGSEVDAVGLLDVWRVSGAEGEDEDTWLKFGVHEFVLWHECAVVFGSFRASGSLLIASPDAAHGWPECTMLEGPPMVPWLTSVTEFTETEGGYELLDADGTTVATLTIDGTPPETPGLDSSIREAPEVTPEVEALFAVPASLPAGLEPVEELVGRWLPVVPPAEGDEAEQPTTEPFIELAADGTWSGSDGCNGHGGRWAATVDGNLIATAGASTLIYCEGAPVGTWMSATALAGMVDDELVLLDNAGTELGRLVRGLPAD